MGYRPVGACQLGKYLPIFFVSKRGRLVRMLSGFPYCSHCHSQSIFLDTQTDWKFCRVTLGQPKPSHNGADTHLYCATQGWKVFPPSPMKPLPSLMPETLSDYHYFGKLNVCENEILLQNLSFKYPQLRRKMHLGTA